MQILTFKQVLKRIRDNALESEERRKLHILRDQMEAVDCWYECAKCDRLKQKQVKTYQKAKERFEKKWSHD